MKKILLIFFFALFLCACNAPNVLTAEAESEHEIETINELHKQKKSCIDSDGVYKGEANTTSRDVAVEMLLDIWQHECIVDGFIQIQPPLHTNGTIRGWIENNVVNFMVIDEQRMMILGEVLHFTGTLVNDGNFEGTFYSEDVEGRTIDEGFWSVEQFDPLVENAIDSTVPTRQSMSQMTVTTGGELINN
ncbi:MAG TPA: hypothetical protein DEZ08_06610 [Dehalococcoidia bacterium]|nr:hypothetical protein [Dehalococcoidia bacterium]|tara:strand:+ start:709 stop:1278 length:570 start_codon:yes stop_codon:yes gene_type:complete